MNLLVDIHLTSGTRYISLEDIYALEFTRITEDGWERITEDGVSRITEESWFYKGNLAQEFEVSESIPDIFYGTVQAGDIEIILADDRTDSWVDIVAAEEIRGVKVVLRHEDRSFIAAGKITGWTIGNDVRIKIGIRADEIFDTLLPAAVVTAAAFTATAVDIGSPVPIVFGYAKNVPLANIQNNTTDDYYDYLIGYGPVESLWIDHSNGRGVKRDGVLVAESEYTFYDGSQGSPYSGYAFIRFVVEQKDFGGNFHSLSADVYGLELGGTSADRSFANCIKAIINNSTYGLNQSINAASFASAATALPTTSWKCDGFIYEQQAAKDILDDLLLPARSWLYLNADGEWCITTDGTGTSAASFGDNDGYYDNCKVESVSCEDATKAIKTAFINYDDDAYQITLAIHTGFGVDKTYSLPFVSDLTTAKKTLSYVYGRAKYADKKLTLAADSEARLLSPGNLISVTSSRHGLTAAVYRIVRINKKLTRYSLDCEGYDSSMFDDQSISSPTAQTGDYATHPLKTIDSGTVGGMSITATEIKTSDGLVGLSSAVTGGTDWRFWAGHATPGSAPFRVDENGKLYATGVIISGAITATTGEIGGWTIGSTTLANGTNIILDSSNKKISINSATFGEKGVQLDYNGGTPRAYIGDGSTKFIKYDGTNTTGNFSGVVNMTAQGGCKVLLSGAQTIADRTTTTIHFNTESWDTRSEFNTSTYRFTLESDSKIIVTAQALSDWEDWYHGSQFSLFIYVNGVNVGGYGTSTLIPSDHEPLNGMRAAIVSNTLDLDANDYIEIKIYHGVDGYSGSSIDIITTYNSTYLTIQKVA